MSIRFSKTDLPTNRSIPQSTVIPVLGYPDVLAAADWLFRAFGFTERLRIGDHRVQLDVGEGSVVVTRTTGLPTGRCTHSIMVRIDDATAHCDRAAKAGARIINEPMDYPHGERQYAAEDFAGHEWTFSQTVADIDPATWGGKLMSASE